MVGWCNIPISKTPFFLRISPPDLPRQLMATSSRNFNSVWWPTMLLQVWATTIWTFKLPTTCSLLLLLINNIFSQPPPLIFSISNSSNHRCLTSRMRFFRPIVPMAPLKIRMQQLPIYWPALFVIWTKSSSNTINLYLRIKWYHINKSTTILIGIRTTLRQPRMEIKVETITINISNKIRWTRETRSMRISNNSIRITKDPKTPIRWCNKFLPIKRNILKDLLSLIKFHQKKNIS